MAQDSIYSAPKKPNVVFNRMDAKGKRNGMWWISEPSRMGDEGYIEFGSYYHGQKQGPWYRISDNNEVISIENYDNNVLNGEAKYFEEGKLTSIGSFSGLNPKNAKDTILVTDAVTGVERYKVIDNERGYVKDGVWRFYDAETGRLAREDLYQAGDLITRKTFQVNSEDSIYYSKRNLALPHLKNSNYKAPKSQRSLTGY